MAKILIVDDSETVLSRMRADLLEAGHEVVTAMDGIEGLEALESNKNFELLILDINMPEMDGLTMCSKIYESGKYSHIPIFVLSTEFRKSMKAKGKAYGVKVWITKPVNTKKLLGVIDKVLSK